MSRKQITDRNDGTIVTISPKSIQYVIGSKGKPTVVLVDLRTWEGILESREDADDVVIAKQVLANLTRPVATWKKPDLSRGKKPTLNWI